LSFIRQLLDLVCFMKNNKLKEILLKHWPFIVITVIVTIFFWKTVLKGLIPFPGDFIVGVYFPWLDYKWGGYVTNVPVKNPLLADIPSLIYPLREYSVEVMKSGEFPLWNPLQFGGYPLLAVFQSAVLYPLNIIYFFIQTPIAWSIQIMLQPLLAAVFTYLFLRNLNLSKIASLLGGVVFAFSGFNVIWMEYNVHGHVAAFIPLVFLLIDKYIKSVNPFLLTLLSITIAVQLFAGYPQVTIYTLFFSIFWILMRIGAKDLLKRKTDIIYLTVFLVLGVGLAALLLIPGYELLTLSQRTGEGVSGGESVAFLPYSQIINLLAPDFFGNPTTGNYWGQGNYTNVAVYAGVITFVLASFTLFVNKSKETCFFIFLALLTIFYALPTPFSRLIHQSGFLGLGAATATRIFVFFNFSLAALAAYGIDIFKRRHSFTLLFRSVFVPFSSLVITAVVLYMAYFRVGMFVDQLNFIIEPEIIMLSEFRVGMRNLLLPILLLMALGIILYLWSKFPKRFMLFQSIILVLVVFELFRFGWKFTPFTDKSFIYPETPVLNYLQEQETPFRIENGDVIPLSLWMPYGLESASGYDAVYPVWWAELISAINTGNPKAGPMGRYGDMERYENNLYNLTNTSYILALKRDEVSSPSLVGQVSYKFRKDNFKQVFEDGSVIVLKNENSVPRAYVVGDWEVEREGVFEKLSDNDFPITEKVIVDKDVGFAKNGKVDYLIKHLRQTNSIREMLVRTDKDGIMFLSESWYPGWEVYVNGNKQETLRANYAFKAVAIPAGEHEVQFIYRPLSFTIGKWVTLVCLLIIITLTKYLKSKKTSTLKIL
jgi:hypothetical protein